MNVTEPAQRARIAKLAYYFYLERLNHGLPGNEKQDWNRAVEAHRLETQPADTPASGSPPVTDIKGIGPKVAQELASHGITTAAQLATWSLSDFGERLPRLTARAKSGRWLEQASEFVKSE